MTDNRQPTNPTPTKEPRPGRGLIDRGAAAVVTHNGRAAVTESGRGHGRTDPARGVVA